jgi:hypothetical protein
VAPGSGFEGRSCCISQFPEMIFLPGSRSFSVRVTTSPARSSVILRGAPGGPCPPSRPCAACSGTIRWNASTASGRCRYSRSASPMSSLTARPGQRQAARPSHAAYTSTRGSGPPRPPRPIPDPGRCPDASSTATCRAQARDRQAEPVPTSRQRARPGPQARRRRQARAGRHPNLRPRRTADFERKLVPIGQPQSLHMRAHPGKLVEEDGQLSTKRAVVRINGVLARVARSSVTPTARPAVAPRIGLYEEGRREERHDDQAGQA